MRANPLPNGFVDFRGAYIMKSKPIWKQLLSPEEVNSWKEMLEQEISELDVNDKIDRKRIQKELDKLVPKKEKQH